MLTRAMVRYHIPDAIAVLSHFFATIAGAWAAPVSPATLQGANNALIQWWQGGAAGAGPAADTGVDIDLPSPNDIMRHVLNTVGGVAAAATNIHAFAVYIDILGAFSRGVISRHLQPLLDRIHQMLGPDEVDAGSLLQRVRIINAASVIPRPAPPYSVGMAMPSQPASASAL